MMEFRTTIAPQVRTHLPVRKHDLPDGIKTHDDLRRAMAEQARADNTAVRLRTELVFGWGSPYSLEQTARTILDAMPDDWVTAGQIGERLNREGQGLSTALRHLLDTGQVIKRKPWSQSSYLWRRA